MCPTIPGEDPQEFQELHSALIDEWQPSGPTEADAVLSLADLMWRKRRAQRFIQVKLKADTFFADRPTFIETRGLVLFAYFMASEQKMDFEMCAKLFLTADNVGHLKQKFPRSNYQSRAEWALAVITEIKSIYLSKKASEPAKKPDDLGEAMKLTRELYMANVVYHSREFFEHELNLRERLDAMIDRKVKHLAQLKVMKEMLRQTATAREDKQPKRIMAGSGTPGTLQP